MINYHKKLPVVCA